MAVNHDYRAMSNHAGGYSFIVAFLWPAIDCDKATDSAGLSYTGRVDSPIDFLYGNAKPLAMISLPYL